MNKRSTMKKALLTLFVSGLGFLSFGQVLLTESFEGAEFPPAGWTTKDQDGDTIDNWSKGNPAWMPASDGNSYAASYSWYAQVAKTPDNWLITPQLTIPNDQISLTFEAVGTWGAPNGAAGDFLEVYISTTGTDEANFTSVFSQYFTTEAWEKVNISLAAYAGNNIYVAFRHHNSSDQWFIGLDKIAIAAPFVDLANDGMANPSVYTSVPITEAPHTLASVSRVKNVGTLPIANYSVNSFIFKDGNEASPVKTFNFSGTNLLPDSTALADLGTFDVTEQGTYTVRNVAVAASDINGANDTLERVITISDKTYARENGLPLSWYDGIAGTQETFGHAFAISTPTLLDSVTFATQADTLGGNFSIIVTKFDENGVADSVNFVGMSADIPVDQAMVDNNSTNGLSIINVPVTKADGSGKPVVLTEGRYLIALRADAGVTRAGALLASGYTSAFYYASNNGGFGYVGFNSGLIPILRAHVSEFTGPVITSSDSDNTACAGETIVLTSNKETGNVWSTGETTQTIKVTTSGIITLTVDGVDAEPVEVFFIDASEPSLIGNNPTTCGGSDGSIDVTLSGTGIGTLYWTGTATGSMPTTDILQSIAGLAAGGYVVTYDNGSGCLSTQHAVSLNEPGANIPVIGAAGATTFCMGDSVRLGSSVVGGNTWSTTEATDSITVSSSGSFFVVNNSNGCVGVSDAIAITVNALPVVNGGADQSICNGDQVTLKASGDADNYLWSGGPLDGVPFAPVATGDYVVTGTDGNGCVSTDTVTVVVGNPPSVTFDALNNTCTYYDPTTLVAVPAGGEFTGQGVAGTTFNPIGLPAGTYTITYEVVVDGCSGSATQTIVVDSCLSLSTVDQARLQVYPNPSTGEFTVAADNLNDYDVIELLDQTGRVIGSWKIDQVTMNIEAGDVRKGNYLLVIRGEKGRLVRQLSIMK
ncbi:MAG: T9SS type A sorting domain-containing protein [Bacteroidetes bacterium]|nr:MAG: T9SS type A sorting domain-containing protein [Bacteroidota bacterium]